MIANDYATMYFGDRQVEITHFFPVNWTEDSEVPTRFAFGYWTPDAVFHQGYVSYRAKTGTFGTEIAALQDHRICAAVEGGA